MDKLEITPQMVEAEARRFALNNAGQLLLNMADQGLTEQDLADKLGVSLRTLRFYLRGQNWRAYLPIMAVCLSLRVRMDMKLTPITPP